MLQPSALTPIQNLDEKLDSNVDNETDVIRVIDILKCTIKLKWFPTLQAKASVVKKQLNVGTTTISMIPARYDFSREICRDVKLVRRIRMAEDVIEEGLQAVLFGESTLKTLSVWKLDQDSQSPRNGGIWSYFVQCLAHFYCKYKSANKMFLLYFSKKIQQIILY